MDELSELLIDSKSNEKFNRIFKNLVRKNKYFVEKCGSTDYYTISDGKNSLGFDISAEKYDYIKNKNLAVCDTLMERIRHEFYILERLVSFTNGQEFLRYTVMRREEISKEMVYDSFIGDLRRVICYTGDNVSARILDESYMKKWDVPKEVLFSVADRNMCRMLPKAEFAEKKISCGIEINCLDFKAEGNDFTVALMMCSDFREYISSKIGSRFLAAAPSKNTLLVLSEVTNDVLERLGTAIVSEYRWASHPLTTDIFYFSSTGIDVAGHFSEIDAQ